MKDCCKTGDEEPKSNWSKWWKVIVISAVVLAIFIVLMNQLNS
ncbi:MULTISPECIES: hypothetical protein [Pontibacter]|nr:MULTISPECIES: hypothetical protein [Pontibacter]